MADFTAAQYRAAARILNGIAHDRGDVHGATPVVQQAPVSSLLPATSMGADEACGSHGPPRAEVDEDNPTSGVPPLVWNAPQWLAAKRRKRPSVGYAQQLLNRFLTQVRLFGATALRGSSLAANVEQWIAQLKAPTLTVDCVFGPETEKAAKAFQACFGLKVDGKVGPVTWPVLRSRSDFIQIQVTDARGRPLSRRRYTLTPTDRAQRPRQGTLDSSGAVRLLGMAPGKYDFRLADSPTTGLVVVRARTA